MSTDLKPVSGAGHRDIDDLTAELETIRLQVVVALDVTPLIYRTVYEHGDQIAVVADIVACWQRLAPAVRDTYRDCPTGSAPGRFGGEYVELVERGAFADLDEAVLLSNEQEENLTAQRWQAHLADVRRRTILRQPPPEDWLAQFPPTEDPAP